MKKLIPASLLVLALLLTACSTASSTQGGVDGGTESPSSAAAQTYKMNEVAVAGPGAYTVTSVEKLEAIPAASTLPEFANIAVDMPAGEGFVWVHAKGTFKNVGTESEALDVTNLNLRDDKGNEYDASTDVAEYVSDDVTPIYLPAEPGETKNWEAYFLAPKDATGLKIYGNDLSFMPEAEVYIDLGM